VTACGLFSMLVPLLFFLTLQRYFVRGLTSGAVKG
jgi:alpha-glucoside transport system permease protein